MSSPHLPYRPKFDHFTHSLPELSVEALERMIADDPELLDCVDFLGRTPLYVSVAQDNKKHFDALLRLGADVNAGSEKRKPLHGAVIWMRSEMVASLIQHGADLEVRDEHGATPLLAAVERDFPEIAFQLLDAGANPFALKDDGTSLRSLLTENLDYQIIKKLDDYERQYRLGMIAAPVMKATQGIRF